MKELKLTGSTLVALVDDEDYDRLIKYSWCLIGQNPRIKRSYTQYTKGFYSSGEQFIIKESIRVTLPNEIMQDYSYQMYDHIDRNYLNNLKSNLRKTNYSQNAANRAKSWAGTSKYKGVSWSKITHNWESRITCRGKTIRLGFYPTEIDAAKAYNEAAIKLHGEFAVLNKIGETNGNGTTE